MRTRRPALIAVVMLASPALAALWGCGRSTLLDDGPTGPSSSSTLPEASTPTPDGGITPDGAILDDASPQPTPAPSNTGVLIFVNSGGGLGASGATSFYAEFDLGMRGEACETRQAGACVYQTCPAPFFGIPGLPAGPLGDTVSAGTLTLAGGELGGVVLTAMGGVYGFGQDTLNPPGQGPLTFFIPGDTLTVSASGGVVPAFTAAPVTVPQSGTLVTPELESDNKNVFYAVSTSEDLVVQWSGGEPGAQFLLQGAGNGNASFLCTWDATLGQGVVPQSVFAPFKGVGLNGTLVWYQQRLSTFTAGEFAMEESVLQYGPLSQAAYY